MLTYAERLKKKAFSRSLRPQQHLCKEAVTGRLKRGVTLPPPRKQAFSHRLKEAVTGHLRTEAVCPLLRFELHAWAAGVC